MAMTACDIAASHLLSRRTSSTFIGNMQNFAKFCFWHNEKENENASVVHRQARAVLLYKPLSFVAYNIFSARRVCLCVCAC